MSGFSKISAVIPRSVPDNWSAELIKWIRNNFSLTQQGIDSAKQNYGLDLSIVGTDANLLEKNLYALPLLGGLLPETQKCSLLLEVFGTLANNTNGKTLRSWFGGTKLLDTGVITTAGGLSYYGFFKIYPTGLGTQKYRALMFIDTLPIYSKTGIMTENLSTAIFRFTGQNSVANLNDIVRTGVELELNKTQAPNY